ncbi:hypothetical protein BRC81_00210 [Halobacteriales archaeon QS_1_68_20]|nr:MAG: hypothetical protein BRC81_00210 [Halobacteriales archaeon QS_1_68_20]
MYILTAMAKWLRAKNPAKSSGTDLTDPDRVVKELTNWSLFVGMALAALTLGSMLWGQASGILGNVTGMNVSDGPNVGGFGGGE